MGTSPSFEKVGECLYRNPASGTYYALVKVRGKQIKSSLKPKNLLEARRKPTWWWPLCGWCCVLRTVMRFIISEPEPEDNSG
jgi:hypothetical protein